MAGLLPANFKNVQTYPEEGKYCRVLNQHLIRRPFKIRFAEVSDMADLMRLEELAWAENLRAVPDVIRRRLETSPTTNLVCELKGKVVAVLYMQQIDNVDVVNSERFMEISEAHSPEGRVMQLIAISVDPEVSTMGIGSELRAFALHLARLDPAVDTVIGVTRCRDFKNYTGTMEQYIEDHVAGRSLDPIVEFHTSYGAKVVRLVDNFRPEDTDNYGIGVLIQYNVKEVASTDKVSVGKVEGSTMAPTLQLLSGIMEDLGYPVDSTELGKGFFDYGMDSLELVRIRNKLSSTLAMELPATLLLDFPTVQDLALQLDKERGIGVEKEALVAVELPPEEKKVGWDNMQPQDLLDMQEECRKAYSAPTYQRKFTETARKCYPDMLKYVLAIEPILIEVEGGIMKQHGLIEGTDWATVQEGRGQLTNCLMKYWRDVPELRMKGNELLHVTKQDQVWS